MFKDKNIRCNHCNKEVKSKFDYCPYCASPLKDMKKEYGLLGRTDDIGEMDEKVKKGFAGNNGVSGSFIDKIVTGAFSSAMKMLDKEFKNIAKEEIKMQKEMAKMPQENMKTNFELYINGKKVNLPGNIEGIQVEQIPGKVNVEKAKVKRIIPKISEEMLKKSKKLPRKEVKSKVSRTADKVLYELNTPGLNSLNNVLINKLENSIEVKAFTDKAVYIKSLPIKLPLARYSLKSDGSLILEFKA